MHFSYLSTKREKVLFPLSKTQVSLILLNHDDVFRPVFCEINPIHSVKSKEKITLKGQNISELSAVSPQLPMTSHYTYFSLQLRPSFAFVIITVFILREGFCWWRFRGFLSVLDVTGKLGSCLVTHTGTDFPGRMIHSRPGLWRVVKGEYFITSSVLMVLFRDL